MSKLLSQTRQNDETRRESRRFLPSCKIFLALPLKIGYNKEAFMFNERVRPTTESAGVLELADETDSKSVGGNTVWVRPPSPAPIVPKWFLPLRYFLFCAVWQTYSREVLPGCLPFFPEIGPEFARNGQTNGAKIRWVQGRFCHVLLSGRFARGHRIGQFASAALLPFQNSW